MSYCINPDCHNRQNPEDTKYCMTCRTPLLLCSDRFQIVEKISTSHPSHAWEVFKVIDTTEQSASRYKVLKTLKNSSSLHKELFDREKTALRNLRHSGIPAYIFEFTLPAERGRPELHCLIMELIEGQDLSKWVELNKLSDQEKALKWLKKIVTILSYIHSKKYFHRDIKPGNIMLKGNEELFLIDYGIVREITDTVCKKGADTKAYTVAYAAPEQEDGKAVPQSDFYALGRTFLHLVTGMSPLSPKLDMSLWELETNFSTSGIIPLLKWMLEEKPTQRPQTPEEIIEIIDYISSRKPDGNFPTAKDTEVQINASKGKHEQKIIPEETTILPKENTSKPLEPDAKEVLLSFVPKQQRLNTTAFPWLKSFKIFRRVPKILPIFFMLLAAGTVLIIHIVQPKLDTVCDFDTDNKISCGEEILLPEQDQGSRTKKKGGAQAIARKNYREAIKLLTEDWNITKDPETLIMIENAKIAQITTPIRNIAINIPASNTPAPIATAMLKAVAFAQQEWNKNTENKWKLRLILVDDANDEGKAVKRTELLLKRGVHAAIGNYSSKVTLVTKKNYQENRTVLISGTSTAGSLTSPKQDTFFFRVCSTNEKSGSKVKSYLIKNNYKKIALFRNQGEPFSDSITKELERNVGTNNIVKYFDYKNNEPIDNQIKEAKALGAQAIVLFPGAYASDSSERKKSLSIIEKNNGDLPIIANEVVKDQTLLSLKTKQLQNLVITLPWHPSTLESNEIKSPPDWWGEKAQLDHRIVLNYDAIKIIIEAIDEIPVDNENIVEIRQKIQKILSAPEFKTKGYTGEISFEGSDRRELISSLIKPSCNGSNKCKGFEAVP